MGFIYEGYIEKLRSDLSDNEVQYWLGDKLLNTYISKKISIEFLGRIQCFNCQKIIKKTFGNGLCFPCFMSLPSSDQCIIKPELCHFHAGTCRDEKWGKDNCFKDHIVYLSYTSGVKVGITRKTQIPTRWIDQGAILALPIMKVVNRKISGEIEQIFSTMIADKTHWKKMLTTSSSNYDLVFQREAIFENLGEEIDSIEEQYQGECEILDKVQIKLNYPVFKYPENPKNVHFEKVKIGDKVAGIFHGIKGQYIMIDELVINMRRHTGFKLRIEIS